MRGGWPGWTASGHNTSRHGEVKAAGGLPAKVGTTHLSCGQKARLKENYGPTQRLDFGSVDGMKLVPKSTRMMQCECRKVNVRKINVWKAINKHAGKQMGSSLNPLRDPQWSRQAVRIRMWTLVEARMRTFGSHSLGVSTFPWGRVTDTRERKSRHLSFYDP
ncbi:hypothetical protein CRG98_020235 [Punica granatum]|uniref:Uncharacterized protein n=1 Tax=Punica granatum TaxID=22663 RepID=A0A2I0JSS2_PUNGR|nr:hypothetical protein CRG98_020235 [Punica granatum]